MMAGQREKISKYWLTEEVGRIVMDVAWCHCNADGSR